MCSPTSAILQVFVTWHLRKLRRPTYGCPCQKIRPNVAAVRYRRNFWNMRASLLLDRVWLCYHGRTGLAVNMSTCMMRFNCTYFFYKIHRHKSSRSASAAHSHTHTIDDQVFMSFSSNGTIGTGDKFDAWHIFT